MKKMFYDLETTGLDKVVNGIHQISGCIEIDGEVVEYFNYKVRPKDTAVYDQGALDTVKITEAEMRQYPPMSEVYKQFTEMLSKYVNKFDSKDKFFLVGFNNAGFDNPFFRQWFEENGDKYFGSWFWANSLDVFILATEFLLEQRQSMKDFKLMTVARQLGMEIDESKLHDAVYDIELTRSVYRIVSNRNYPKPTAPIVEQLEDLPF
jgi:DNA polymerase-3 subunit epsilon